MSRQEHTIIYITGLNDKNVTWQKLAIGLWSLFGVRPVIFQTNWADTKPYSEKLDRLLALIDDLSKRDHAISLVAASAGASLAVMAFVTSREYINGAAFICGKLRRPETVGELYYSKNPAFKGAMDGLNASIAKLSDKQKARMLSIHPLLDETVAISDTKIKGVKSVTIPTLFHVPTIALGLSIFSSLPILFLKRQTKTNL